MSRLLTLTANILAEFTGEYSEGTAGRTHRATNESFQVGGKGINVARMAQRLGIESTAFYLAGGKVGDLCEGWLAQQPFASKRIRTEERTRAGWVVRLPSGTETTFLGLDRPVDPADWDRILSAAGRYSGNIRALCGSVPGWTPAHASALEKAWFPAGRDSITAYLDSYGAVLESLFRLPWSAIKINRAEFSALLEGDKVKDPPSVSLPELANQSEAQAWIVTDGEGPVAIFSKTEGYFEIVPPRVKVQSPTGSGDVFLAGLIEGHCRRRSLRAACKRATSLAAANAAHPGVAAFALPSDIEAQSQAD